MKKVTTLLIVYFFKILEIESVPVVDWCNITGNASGFVRGEKVFRLQLPDKDVENLVQCYCKIELYGIWWPSPYIYLENFEKLTNNCQRQRKILVNGMYQQHPCGEQGRIDIYNNVRYNSITVGVEEIPRISNTSGYITIELSKMRTNTVTCGYIINQTSTVQPTTKLKWRLFNSSPITTKIQATRLSRFTTNPTTPTSMKRLETEPSSYSSSKTTNKLTNPNTSKTGISTLATLKNSLKTTVRSTSSTIPVVSSKKNRNTGIIAGVITGIIVLAVVVIVGMIVVCRRKGRCKFPKPNDENQPTYHPWRPSVDSNCSTDTMNTCISWSANDNQEQPTYEIIPGDNPSYTQEDTTDAYQPWGNGTDNVIAGIEAKLQHTEKSNEDDHEMQVSYRPWGKTDDNEIYHQIEPQYSNTANNETHIDVKNELYSALEPQDLNEEEHIYQSGIDNQNHKMKPGIDVEDNDNFIELDNDYIDFGDSQRLPKPEVSPQQNVEYLTPISTQTPAEYLEVTGNTDEDDGQMIYDYTYAKFVSNRGEQLNKKLESTNRIDNLDESPTYIDLEPEYQMYGNRKNDDDNIYSLEKPTFTA